MRDYENLFNHTANPMCEVDLAGRVERVNTACRALLGEAAPRVGGKFSDLFAGQERDELDAFLEGLSADVPTAVAEGLVVSADIWTSWQLTRVADDCIVAVGRDITEHRRTSQALEEKSAFLHSIIEAEPECVKLLARDGEVLDMNRAGLTMVGAENRCDAIGLNVYDLLAPEDRQRFVEFNERVCDGAGGEMSYDIIALDGTRRSMESTAVPLPTAHGDQVVHLAITRDVSRRRLLEEQLRRAQRMEAIGALAGGVAHDFNNLLTAIIGPAELALRELDSDHPVARDLAQIKATGERAARLTHQLLAFSRHQVVQPQAVSLAELVNSTEEMLRRVLGETYALELEIDPKARAVRADRGQLEQVLLNLVVNARDAIKDGGTIRIEVANEDVDAVRAERLGCAPGLHVRMTVTDNGVGIEKDALPNIFDPFFTTKPPGSGTGLGLATCQSIVTQLEGAIEVASEQGYGTTITILIPALAGDVAFTRPLAEPVRGNAERVLLVEDEAGVRHAVSRMLTALDYVVYSAADGTEALSRAEHIDNLSLLLTDMTMPGMSGRELAERMHAIRPDLRVLYMSGYLPGPEPDGLGHDSLVLPKPFTSRTLADAVARALGARATG